MSIQHPVATETARWPTPARIAGIGLTAAIVELTLTTAYIHLGLGGPLFTVNAIGYVALAVAVAAAAVAPAGLKRFGWLPRVGLAGYTATTIGAYLVMGPYFGLGWIAKGIELAILTLLVADLLRRYGSPAGLLRAAPCVARHRSAPDADAQRLSLQGGWPGQPTGSTLSARTGRRRRGVPC
jgi:hypothetical protein